MEVKFKNFEIGDLVDSIVLYSTTSCTNEGIEVTANILRTLKGKQEGHQQNGKI